MNLAELKRYVEETYGVLPDDVSCDYRQPEHRKWFAITMNVPYRTLGIDKDGSADVMNVKCDPLAIGSFRENPGFLPAYHMNKSHWISVLLDGSVPDERIRELTELSYEKTKPPVGSQ